MEIDRFLSKLSEISAVISKLFLINYSALSEIFKKKTGFELERALMIVGVLFVIFLLFILVNNALFFYRSWRARKNYLQMTFETDLRFWSYFHPQFVAGIPFIREGDRKNVDDLCSRILQEKVVCRSRVTREFYSAAAYKLHKMGRLAHLPAHIKPET